MNQTKRQILVTSALPYANGDIHLGHLVEYIQTDIWVRFQKMCGHHCIYLCADDAHGTAIMLAAQKQQISPEQLIKTIQENHIRDFSRFHISFDQYYTTHSQENRTLSEFIYQQAQTKSAIYSKEIKQFYDEAAGIFLADRYIKGVCPYCKSEDQYGDSCEKCYATYSIDQLIDPRSVLTQTQPVKKSSEHYFFKLSQFKDHILDWLSTHPVIPEVRNKLDEWLKDELKDWDISRDAPYFGFEIPGTTDKYFYVWLDAPVGYLATTQKWCEANGQSFDNIWRNETYEIHHFIGKDILYFHTLFWPAMLQVAGFRQPNHVHVHGFLTVHGEKMSKSRGTFILAQTYADLLDPDLLRYYYATKLSPSIEDIDLNLQDFVYRVNADLVNKFANIGSRLGAIVEKKLDLRLSQPDEKGQQLLDKMSQSALDIAAYYDALAFGKAMKAIIQLAEEANQYIQEEAPWVVVKSDPEKARQICTSGLNMLKFLATVLSPVVPTLSDRVFAFLDIQSQNWDTLSDWITDCHIKPFQHLIQRVELDVIQRILD